MNLKFTKMQGCGNDYIYINCFEQDIESPNSLSTFLSDRHFGIGGDGIVLICPSEVADAKMRMFNIDGSEGKMCGNAIRCVAKYLYDNGLVPKLQMYIETLSGVKNLKLTTKNNLVSTVCVDMGKAELNPSKIPVLLNTESVINYKTNIDNNDFYITCVSMGNPHCVVFCDNIDTLNLEKLGTSFETNHLFPEQVNTEFVKIIDEHTIQMRVWERGSGETLACGTGACAAVVASVLNGYCKKGENVKVILVGGELTINYMDNCVLMTGPCEKVFEGIIEL